MQFCHSSDACLRLVQLSVRRCIPSPQVFEQDSHVDQEIPCTVINHTRDKQHLRTKEVFLHTKAAKTLFIKPKIMYTNVENIRSIFPQSCMRCQGIVNLVKSQNFTIICTLTDYSAKPQRLNLSLSVRKKMQTVLSSARIKNLLIQNINSTY